MRHLINTTIAATELAEFKSILHVGMKCSCGKMCVSAVTVEDAALALFDPVVAFLQLLSRDERKNIVEFWSTHEMLGHKLEPQFARLPIGEIKHVECG